ncbi:helix-turn-helix domain-containing protein [Streptomyces sp. NPDC001633]|uniref:helix-turn-helix domain-containing protein n=1 Tax=Streptomyces sp. NPDC001633 TaxID=3364595 RepID=UPI0036AACAF2
MGRRKRGGRDWREARAASHAALIKRWASTQQITPPQWIKDEVELARLLDQMRRFRGLSLRGLARRSAGFSHHTYGAVLHGDRPVMTDVLLAMLQACKVDPGPAQRWLSGPLRKWFGG